MPLNALLADVNRVATERWYGRVVGVQGLLVEVAGAESQLAVGARLSILSRSGEPVLAEVVGFRNARALCLPYAALDGVGVGCKAYVEADEAVVFPSNAWLGRVVSGLGEAVDGKGPLPRGAAPQPVRNRPPAAHARDRVGEKIDLGVRALNTFAPCCRGQRLGLFAGSGVGKSVLLSIRRCRGDVR
jgi:flagellum-specific ATP synthase